MIVGGYQISVIRYQEADAGDQRPAIGEREAGLGIGSCDDRTRIPGFLISDI
jgi:hypothetical protein